ncbi:hypothetical protein EB796_017220 [Bugula neritina]|uniref:Uncharacterized protein n=1 Tax=Bugula neritina TaxID=10212 RepID=A0A7J7JDU2_BUGNE|nr:hypothetical protein EB796_017220 [Bugula neritina]
MADVTIKLLWYRLTESTDNLVILWDSLKFLVAAGGTVLNYIFLFWIIIGFLTIIVITFLQNKDQLSSSTIGTTDQPSSFICIKCKSGLTASSGQLELKSADSVSWLNQVLQWTNLLNSRWKDSLTDHLLSSMTEESKKIGGDLFVTFEAVLPADDCAICL